MKRKIAIVGRGFAGLTSAIVLSEAGFEVSLVGPNKTVTTASSAAHGANTIKGLHEASQALFGLKISGHKSFPSWLRHIEIISGVEIPMINGVYERFESHEKFKREQDRIYKSRFLGAFAVEAKMQTRVWFQNYYPQDFWIDSDIYLSALDTAKTKVGVSVATDKDVVEILEDADKSTLILRGGGSLSFDAVVLAVGAELGAINLPVDVKGAVFGAPGLTMKADLNSNDLGLAPFCAVKELNAVAIYRQKIYAGSTTTSNAVRLPADFKSEASTIVDDADAAKQFKSIYERVLINKCPDDLANRAELRWGVRVRSRDRIPIVGPISAQKRIYLNTGYYKSGISLTPIGAKFLLELLRNKSIGRENPMTSQRYFPCD